MHWYFDAWQRYAQFSGRASREAFWMFFLVNSLISMAFVLAETFYQSTWKIEAIYSLAIFLPLLSLTVRRLHDTQRSAWWLSVILIPVIGMVMLLILLTLPSEPPLTDMDSPQHGNTL
ncbi:MAG: DUF805 domain-containing protein [Gammaproteobacteria bacterium]|uniref:DUF805 domain-containing protein n=1 Tax=Vreelandella venusta TaxID=44935 RepID=UPI00295EC9E2|nr:DUF805 domain-containing protein [Halomonas venusta]MBR9925894.1 DUF805 domain-containing protein [Gammaproteobacteria bacterium]MDW0359647.1 DUF805 domain-containing protein [Halomonas venusta]MDX1714947.1 DUF805 domain-containing protein [Halomonas venusta]